MDYSNVTKTGKCPNDETNLVFFNHPIDLLYVLPEDLLDYLEGKDTPPGMFGYIIAICQKCGFHLGVQKLDNYKEYLVRLNEHRGLHQNVRDEK